MQKLTDEQRRALLQDRMLFEREGKAKDAAVADAGAELTAKARSLKAQGLRLTQIAAVLRAPYSQISAALNGST